MIITDCGVSCFSQASFHNSTSFTSVMQVGFVIIKGSSRYNRTLVNIKGAKGILLGYIIIDLEL
jgi:hypothetical protein